MEMEVKFICHMIPNVLTQEEYLNILHEVTGISKDTLKKHNVPMKLRNAGAIFCPELKELIKVFKGRHIRIVVEEEKAEQTIKCEHKKVKK